MPLQQLLLTNLAIIAGIVIVLWLVSTKLRNVSIIDIFWGSGFVLLAWTSLVFSGQFGVRSLVLVSMVSVWGLRLSAYLAWRNFGQPEDYRYAAMRQHHGTRFPRVSLFTVFGLQGFLLWIIALPIQVGISESELWQGWCWIGVVIWLTGLLFESVGDFQLARFKADPANRGRVMAHGLWRYTRHPNYFGDFLVWWGLYLVAAQPASWWWTIVGTLLMSFLLIRVSGVRMLEKAMPSRVQGYEQYVQTTSPFLPMPPRRISPRA